MNDTARSAGFFRRFLFNKYILFILIVAAAGTAAWFGYSYYKGSGDADLKYRTSTVQRGKIVLSISATGTVEPEELVDIGAQIAGQIISFGKDSKGKTIDYGSEVEAGTVLAQIDDSLYSAEVAQYNAQLLQAQASLQRAQADQEQLKAKYNLAANDWARAKKLRPTNAIAQSSYDTYESAYETAKANISVGEAAILQAQATIAHDEASLKRAKRNLGYCTIKSPVKGIVIDRRVNIGQTVVSSLNAPSLFLIAKDLKKMQVWTAVNEADIGKIYPGQDVKFTVDAFPGETFHGKVGKIRLNASMTQNVVSYVVEVSTDNSNGRLLPYLTANVEFEIENRPDVMQVSNSALRWTPKSIDQVDPASRKEFAADTEQNGKKEKASKSKASRDANEAILWVKSGKYLRPLKVHTGISNGFMTEVEGKDLSEGMEIVSGVQQKDVDSAASPFTPRISRRAATK